MLILARHLIIWRTIIIFIKVKYITFYFIDNLVETRNTESKNGTITLAYLYGGKRKPKELLYHIL